MEDSSIPPTVPLKVMSFNIAHGLGMNNKVDLEKTALVIEQVQPDVVGLQEVDRCFTARSSFCDQVDWFKQRLGMNVVFGPNLDFDPLNPGMPRRQYGNAILSKHPIRHVKNHLMAKNASTAGSSEQRGMLEAVIEVEGAYVSFFSTHLSLEEQELQVNIQQILDITEKSRFPQILTGDFNARPESPHIKRLSVRFDDVFSKLGKENAYTYPAPANGDFEKPDSKPLTRIDYIFTGPDIKAEKAEVVETAVSDHLPIVANVVLTDSTKNHKNHLETKKSGMTLSEVMI